MSKIQAFDHIESKYTLYREEDCTSLKEHATNVINFEKRKLLPLTKKSLKYTNMRQCHIRGKRFLKRFVNDQTFPKVRDHCHSTFKYRGTAHSICNLRFNVPNENRIVFHNEGNCDYFFYHKRFTKRV